MSDTASASGQGLTDSPPQDSIFDHPLAVVGIVIVTAAAVAGLMLVAGEFSDTGDEPPIRVKNGSVELYLATNSYKWKPKQDAMHWKMGGKRADDPLQVTIAVNAGASCSAQVGTGARLTLVYQKADSKTVTINIGTDPDRPNQKHTAVDSTEALVLASSDPKERLLTYPAKDGFIQSVSLDGVNMCSFTNGGQLANLLILDY